MSAQATMAVFAAGHDETRGPWRGVAEAGFCLGLAAALHLAVAWAARAPERQGSLGGDGGDAAVSLAPAGAAALAAVQRWETPPVAHLTASRLAISRPAPIAEVIEAAAKLDLAPARGAEVRLAAPRQGDPDAMRLASIAPDHAPAAPRAVDPAPPPSAAPPQAEPDPAPAPQREAARPTAPAPAQAHRLETAPPVQTPDIPPQDVIAEAPETAPPPPSRPARKPQPQQQPARRTERAAAQPEKPAAQPAADLAESGGGEAAGGGPGGAGAASGAGSRAAGQGGGGVAGGDGLGGGAGRADLQSRWGAQIRAAIDARKRHPGGGRSGRVVLLITVSSAGEVISAEIGRSSGSAAFDRAAMRAVSRAGTLPRAPEGLVAAKTTFRLPIDFSTR